MEEDRQEMRSCIEAQETIPTERNTYDFVFSQVSKPCSEQMIWYVHEKTTRKSE